MNNICKPGEVQQHMFTVIKEHFPAFKGSTVHEVCSTYVLAREVEWTSRLFVLAMLESDEEGIGTMIQINHASPAFEGEEVNIEATVDSMDGKELICLFSAYVGNRLIAEGKTGQKIFHNDNLSRIFSDLKK